MPHQLHIHEYGASPFWREAMQAFTTSLSPIGNAANPCSSFSFSEQTNDFARKHGILAEQARQLIKQHGNNRETLDPQAES